MRCSRARRGPRNGCCSSNRTGPHRPDPLTGWSGGADTQAQVTIAFPTLEAAKAYADKYEIAYHLVPPPQAKLRLQSYADNFR